VDAAAGGGTVAAVVAVGRDEKLRRITADILPQNAVMQRICEKLGFRLEHDFREGLVKASIELT